MSRVERLAREHERALLDIAHRLGRLTLGDTVGRGGSGALYRLAVQGYLHRHAHGMYRITEIGRERLRDLAPDMVPACKACARRVRAGLPGQCPACANERARLEGERQREKALAFAGRYGTTGTAALERLAPTVEVTRAGRLRWYTANVADVAPGVYRLERVR